DGIVTDHRIGRVLGEPDLLAVFILQHVLGRLGLRRWRGRRRRLRGGILGRGRPRRGGFGRVGGRSGVRRQGGVHRRGRIDRRLLRRLLRQRGDRKGKCRQDREPDGADVWAAFHGGS